jgi:hypothetical protein
MKIFLTIMAISFASLQTNNVLAQLTPAKIADKVHEISNVFTKYNDDLLVNKDQDRMKSTKGDVTRLAYNPKMLNMFIANNIGTYLASSKDISLQKYYAVLEQDATSLFLGYNFLFRKNKLNRLKHIANVGLKTDLSDNFSSIITDGNINPEMALNLKYTYVLRGKIKFDATHRTAIDNYRSKYLFEKYKADLAKYSKNEVAADKDQNTDLEAKLKYAGTLLKDEDKEKLIEDELDVQYEKIATDEEKFITDNKVFNSITSSWFTTEIFIPAGNKKYMVSPATTVFATTDERFYNFKASILYTRMRKWSNKITLYTTLQASAYNMNNIITKELKAYKFETIASQGGNNQTVADSKDAYVGVFKQDFAKSIKGEVVFFFVKDIAGVSAAAEFVGGEFSARNWKLAIPVSLKDKDGKPSINLEVQFKEVYKTHSFGIAMGYAFGKYFN